MQSLLATILNKHGIELTSIPSIEGQTLPILLLAAAAEIEDPDKALELILEADKLIPEYSPIGSLLCSVVDYRDTNDPGLGVVKFVSRHMDKYLPEAKFTYRYGLDANPDLWVEIAGETVPIITRNDAATTEDCNLALEVMRLHECETSIIIAHGLECELPQNIRYIDLMVADFEPSSYSWFKRRELANV